jgi:hypothetical protein
MLESFSSLYIRHVFAISCCGLFVLDRRLGRHFDDGRRSKISHCKRDVQQRIVGKALR